MPWGDDPDVAMAHIGFAVPFSMSGQPACSVPAGRLPDGREVGLQIIGRRFDDVGVLRAAAWFEAGKLANIERLRTRLHTWLEEQFAEAPELVVKDLGAFLGRVPAIAGATIDGDGSVICLLDLRELAERTVGLPGTTATPRIAKAAVTVNGRKPRVLVVEDSVGVRELERVILEGAGYTVDRVDDVGGIAVITVSGPESGILSITAFDPLPTTVLWTTT